MPAQTLTIDIGAYPRAADFEQGEKVKIIGEVSGIDQDGNLEVTTESVELANVNPAKESLKQMMPGMHREKKPMMKKLSNEGGDDGY